jgi:hypothetical protein
MGIEDTASKTSVTRSSKDANDDNEKKQMKNKQQETGIF